MFNFTSPGFLGVIVVAGTYIAGYCAGYQSRDNTAEIEALKVHNASLTLERAQLQEQIEHERARNDAAQIATERTAQELETIEVSYHSALDALDRMQSDHAGAPGNAPALPANTAPAAGNSADTGCKCACKDAGSVKRLSERLLMVARDCDIVNSRLKQCAQMYQALF